MQNGARVGIVLLLAALVAGVVAAVVGGATALLVLRGADPDETRAEPLRVRFDADVAVELTGDRDDADLLLEVPDDAVAVHLSAEVAGGPVVLRARFGDASDGAWDAEEADGSEEPSLDLAEHTCQAFAPGPLLVRIESSGDLGDREPIRATFRATLVRERVEATIDAGASWTGETTRASGFRRTVAVRVPAGAKTLRLDVADAAADLDLHVATGSLLSWREGRRREETSFATAEWIVLDTDAKDPPIPAGGTLLVAVTDPSERPYPVGFRLVTTLGSEPPSDLAALPEIPLPSDPRERAFASVVEILADGAGGSGTLVSADGRILTARHVVESAARAFAAGRDDAPPIVVAMSLDARGISRDLFLAEVVREDRVLDVAMLQVTSGARGTPLPDGLRLPFVRLRRRSATYLGEPLWTAGYPSAGGTGSRVPLTLSRGCVSGWERAEGTTEMKTDAFVAPGSSGGAAIDDRWELLGVVVATMDGGETGRALGTIVPVDAIPAAWFE